jgi:hypothetical protein
MTTTEDGFPKIDRAHSVALNRNCWTDDPEIADLVTRLAEEIGLGDLEKKGNKKPKLTATGMLLILVADLYSNWKLDPTQSIGFSKNNNSYKVKSRYNKAGVSPQIIEIVKRLVDYGYLDEVKGHHDKSGGNNSFTARIRPSLKLRSVFQQLETDLYSIDHHKHAELIILRRKFTDEDGDDWKENIEYADTELTNQWREQIKAYNSLLRRTFIDIPTLSEPFILSKIKKGPRKGEDMVVSIGPDNKHVHRVFNGSVEDNFQKGGRFFGGWWLQVPKTYRPFIHINNEPTVEVDYKAIHPNLLLTEPELDPYTLDRIVLPEFFNNIDDQRSAVKGVVLMAINATSAKKAFGAFRESKDEGDRMKTLSDQQLQKLLDAFTDKYPEIKDALNTGQGLNLMNLDSQIANMIIDYYTKQDIPILCIHDSFIINWKREEELRRIMDMASVQVNGKPIQQDAKKNDTKFTFKLDANPPLQSGATSMTLSVPKRVDRTPQYIERWETHQRQMKAT